MSLPIGNTDTFIGPQPPSASMSALFLRRFRRKTTALIGLSILVLVVLSAAFAPMLTRYEPARIAPRVALQPPGTEGHLLGTDHFGRDQLTRILHGGRVSLRVGLVAVAGLDHGVAGGFQLQAQGQAEVGVVVDDQDGLGVSHDQ